MEARITIPGKPVAKHRPKFARRGKFVTVYNDQGTDEGRALLEIRRQWIQTPLLGPISMLAKFTFEWPKSISEKKKQTSIIHHVKKPDLSNCLKFYEDIFNGWVWKDDSQLYDITVMKEYGDNPRSEFTISWWE
jgi:Holliday junction resolvase RusA-like endonuclease